jgi:hypothetical protein
VEGPAPAALVIIPSGRDPMVAERRGRLAVHGVTALSADGGLLALLAGLWPGRVPAPGHG